jgi:UDP-N-acetylmuramyl tripeptide synthase
MAETGDMIFDRNGQVLARSVEARSIYARPQEITDMQLAANTLGPILGVEPQKLYDDLAHTKRRFVWLKRKVDDYTATAVRKANLSGIGLSKEYDRVYPFKHMGEAVARWSDVAVLTSDNPRFEEPQAILEDVLPGLKSAREVVVEVDRRAATVKALEMLGKDDALLIAGKGHGAAAPPF